MPALPDAAGVIRTALSGTFVGGGVWLTRHYIHYSGTAPTNAQLATFDASVSTAYNTSLKPLANSTVTLTQIASADLTSSTGAVDTTGASIVGTRAGSNFPASTSLVASYTIARRYRGGHPRAYFPFGSDSDVLSETQWNPSFITTCNTNIAAYFTSLLAAGWSGAGTLTHCNVSYYNGFTVVINPITGRARNVPTLRVSPTVDTVTAVACKQSIGTQRRRIGFVD